MLLLRSPITIPELLCDEAFAFIMWLVHVQGNECCIHSALLSLIVPERVSYALSVHQCPYSAADVCAG